MNWRPQKFKAIRKREVKLRRQRESRGWDDSQTWALDETIARHVAPRLKRFKEVTDSYPDHAFPTMEAWRETLDKMIFAMDYLASEDSWLEDKNIIQNRERVQEGCELLGRYFLHLGW